MWHFKKRFEDKYSYLEGGLKIHLGVFFFFSNGAHIFFSQMKDFHHSGIYFTQKRCPVALVTRKRMPA